MARRCSKCSSEESEQVLFPKLGNLCKKCDAERKAAWYQAKKGKKPPKTCADCSNLLLLTQHKYCMECKEKRNITYTKHRRANKITQPQNAKKIPICVLCNNPLPAHRRKYCSEVCKKQQRANEERERKARKADKPIPPAIIEATCEGCGATIASYRARTLCDTCTKDRALKQRLWEAKFRERDPEGYRKYQGEKYKHYAKRHPEKIKEYQQTHREIVNAASRRYKLKKKQHNQEGGNA